MIHERKLPHLFSSQPYKRNLYARNQKNYGDSQQQQNETNLGILEYNYCSLWNEVKNELGKPGMGLSGGQQQRLCIARALAMQPEVLLMDEPTSALDPIASSKIEDLVHDLKKRLTVIIVTHNMQQADRVSDDTVFMYLGEMIEHNPTKKIFENPEKELTERYISGKFG